MSVEQPASFFVRQGAALLPTPLTRGPWNDAHQHGGPPAALLTSALERAEPEPAAFRLVRVTIEFLRPVALEPCAVTTEVVRAGKQVQRLSASLAAGGVEVARALALRIRRAALPLEDPRSPPPLPPPESLQPFVFPFFRNPVAYHRAVDVRIARGTWGSGPVDAWMRNLIPLIAGEPTSPLERVMSLVDAESGVCPPLDPMVYGFPNPDLTVYFAREPRGEWVGLQIESQARSDGTGLAQSALSDVDGVFGRALQSLVIAAR